jgi:hypothetical protein
MEKKDYKSNRNELHRSISGFTYENSDEKDIKDLLYFALDFILEYTPEDLPQNSDDTDE